MKFHQVMVKTRAFVKAKLYNLVLILKDATVVQNADAVAATSAASSTVHIVSILHLDAKLREGLYLKANLIVN